MNKILVLKSDDWIILYATLLQIASLFLLGFTQHLSSTNKFSDLFVVTSHVEHHHIKILSITFVIEEEQQIHYYFLYGGI